MIARSPINRVSRKAKRERASKLAVKVYPDGREVCLRSEAGKAEYKLRTEQLAERQDNRCAGCGFHFDGYLGKPTMDHQNGRGVGGAHRDDRIVVDGKWHNAAMHEICNGLKGSNRFHWSNGVYQPKGVSDGDCIAKNDGDA